MKTAITRMLLLHNPERCEGKEERPREKSPFTSREKPKER